MRKVLESFKVDRQVGGELLGKLLEGLAIDTSLALVQLWGLFGTFADFEGEFLKFSESPHRDELSQSQ